MVDKQARHRFIPVDEGGVKNRSVYAVARGGRVGSGFEKRRRVGDITSIDRVFERNLLPNAHESRLTDAERCVDCGHGAEPMCRSRGLAGPASSPARSALRGAPIIQIGVAAGATTRQSGAR